jgi:HlyD family secretion protein
MNETTPTATTQRELTQAKKPPMDKRAQPARAPSIIVGVVVFAIAAVSIWYLVRPQPLLVQGEVDATRLDIAARVDGRVAEIPVLRGQNVAADAVLVRIDNPETVAKHKQAVAAKLVAEAQLANINVGTRAEVIAARKAALERAQASVVLAQKTYDRVSQLAEYGNAPQARLDQATDSLHESQPVQPLARMRRARGSTPYFRLVASVAVRHACPERASRAL